MDVADVIVLLSAAQTVEAFNSAARWARRLKPHAQLGVVDAYLAARSRCLGAAAFTVAGL